MLVTLRVQRVKETCHLLEYQGLFLCSEGIIYLYNCVSIEVC